MMEPDEPPPPEFVQLDDGGLTRGQRILLAIVGLLMICAVGFLPVLVIAMHHR